MSSTQDAFMFAADIGFKYIQQLFRYHRCVECKTPCTTQLRRSNCPAEATVCPRCVAHQVLSKTPVWMCTPCGVPHAVMTDIGLPLRRHESSEDMIAEQQTLREMSSLLYQALNSNRDTLLPLNGHVLQEVQQLILMSEQIDPPEGFGQTYSALQVHFASCHAPNEVVGIVCPFCYEKVDLDHLRYCNHA
jgi:hypothetical protein